MTQPMIISLSNDTDGIAAHAALSDAIKDLDQVAAQQQLEVRWAILMRGVVFRIVTIFWPERPIVRRGKKYLLIEGKKYEVIVDDTITETQTASGGVQSDLYFVPLTANGEPVWIEMPEKQATS